MGHMADTFNTRHKQTGILQRLTADQISVFPDDLEIVADDAKPFEPGEFFPGAPEPLTDAQIAAQADLDAALEQGSSRTKAAREAKAAKEAADEAAAVDTDPSDLAAGAPHAETEGQ